MLLQLSHRFLHSNMFKRPGREVEHSPPSSAEIGNGWSYTSTPTVCLHGVVLSLKKSTGTPLLYWVYIPLHFAYYAYSSSLKLSSLVILTVINSMYSSPTLKADRLWFTWSKKLVALPGTPRFIACSKQSATCPSLEPVECNPYPHTLFYEKMH